MKPTDQNLGITRDMIAARFTYERERGRFRHIKGNRNMKGAVGMVAGFKRPDGYVQIKVDGRAVLAHRLVWFFETGEWPGPLDHINGKKSDNRIANLRQVPRSINHLNNFKANKNNLVTGLRGVSHDKRKRSYRPYFMKDGVRRYGKTCRTAEEAGAIRAQMVLAVLPSQEGAYHPEGGSK